MSRLDAADTLAQHIRDNKELEAGREIIRLVTQQLRQEAEMRCE